MQDDLVMEMEALGVGVGVGPEPNVDFGNVLNQIGHEHDHAQQVQRRGRQQDQPYLINPQNQSVRPLDLLGPPANPIDFPRPTFERGCRREVLCYNPTTGTHQVLVNVLFRDYSREADENERLQEAYWSPPEKPNIRTIMGHVEICYVLERCRRNRRNSTTICEAKGSDSDDSSSYDDEDIVFQCSDRLVAVKVNYCDRMERMRNRHAEDPLKEIAAMQLIRDDHPNVLGCREVLFDGANLNVVMRFCDSGDLFQVLQDRLSDAAPDEPPGMPEGLARYWFRQFMQGLQYIHSKGIAHRDLSPENFMINQNTAMVIDMGMCLRVPYQSNTDPHNAVDRNHPSSTGLRRWIRPQGTAGKMPYMSPEIFKNHAPFDGFAADVWTAGTILFCMLTGNRSYQQPLNSDPQFYWMTHDLRQLLTEWGVHLSTEGLHLLQNMLQVRPRLRLTVEEILNHPWLALPDEPPVDVLF